jgi:hypothetical protein
MRSLDRLEAMSWSERSRDGWDSPPDASGRPGRERLRKDLVRLAAHERGGKPAPAMCRHDDHVATRLLGCPS